MIAERRERRRGGGIGDVIMRFPVIALLALLPGVASSADGFEPDKRSLAASALLPSELLSGPHHRVDPEAVIEGFVATFRVVGDSGDFHAEGTPAVAMRVQEMEAIARLRALERTDVFAEAMKSTAKRPVEAVRQTVQDPVGTAKKIPGGVVRLFRRTKRQVEDGYGNVQEALEERREGQTSGTAGDEAASSISSDDVKVVAEKGYDAGKDYALDQVGYNSSYREVARRLGVDPYTDNDVLREEMQKVAWVAAAGSLGMGELMPSVPKGFDHLADVNELVWNSHPVDLRIRNEDKLREMGISEPAVNALLDNPRFTPTDITRIVQSLVALEDVDGRAAIVGLAGNAETRAEARFYVAASGLLAAYHAKRHALSRLEPVRRLVIALTRDGTAIIPVAVDSLAWTEEAASAAPELGKAAVARSARRRDIWVRGQVSDRARRELDALGWQVLDMSAWEALVNGVGQ